MATPVATHTEPTPSLDTNSTDKVAGTPSASTTEAAASPSEVESKPAIDLATEPVPTAPSDAPAASADPAPAAEKEITVDGWGTLKPSHPLIQLHAKLPAILKAAGHSQIWGVTLDASTPNFATLLILQKYLRSVADNVEEAATALEKTLKWRAEFGLDKATPIWEENFGAEFNGLGYVTRLNSGEVVTWNLYGAVKDLGETFGNLDK